MADAQALSIVRPWSGWNEGNPVYTVKIATD